MPYSCYQFTNALADGHPRVLDILVAENRDGNSIIAESAKPKAQSEPAFLLLRHMAGNYTPAEYFRLNYKDEDPRAYRDRAMYLCVYGGSPRHLYLLREDPSTGQLRWLRTEAQDQIPWVIRSRSGYTFGHLRYLYAVPLDIITSPYQLYVAMKLSHG
jgi:hypothetical protein